MVAKATATQGGKRERERERERSTVRYKVQIMAILINPTNHDYFDEVDPTFIILSLAISISIFPFIVAMVFRTMDHYYLPLSSWLAKRMFPHYPPSSLFLSGRNNNSNPTSQRGRRASINGTGNATGSIGGGGGRNVKKTRMTTMTRTTTLRDMLLVYQDLLSAGYLAFPMWIIYRSVGNTIRGSDNDDDDDDNGEGLTVSSKGVYSFVAILTLMGIICHNVRVKISSSYNIHPPQCCAAGGDG